MRKYAFLKNNIIDKIADLEEEGYVEMMKIYPSGVDIEDAYPLPDVGWILIGQRLIPPIPVPSDPVAYVRDMIYKPTLIFCNNLMNDFISENIAMGITQAGKTKVVGEALKDLDFWLSCGSLYVVLAEIETLKQNLDPAWVPFITATRMTNFANKIKDYLHIAY